MNDGHHIKAATNILICQTNGVLKILLVKRGDNLKFAAKHYAFPGGKIDESDIKHANDDILKAAKIAAIRETYEEIGILICKKNEIIENAKASEIEIRKQIIKSPEIFIQKLNISIEDIEFNELIPLSRWQPPEPFHPKFDTYFFIKQCDREIEFIVDNSEISTAIWIEPIEAIRRHKKGEMDFIFPTIITINLLAKLNNIKAIKDFIKWNEPPLIKGEIIEENGKTYQTISEELGYPLYRMDFLF